MIVDTGVLFAAANRRDSNRSACRLLVETQPRFVVSALVVAEAAYLIGETLGPSAETAFIRSLATDHYLVEGPTRSDLARIAELMAAYESLPLGATDAAVIALAERQRDPVVATLDRRHFTVVVAATGPFTLLPETIVPSQR